MVDASLEGWLPRLVPQWDRLKVPLPFKRQTRLLVISLVVLRELLFLWVDPLLATWNKLILILSTRVYGMCGSCLHLPDNRTATERANRLAKVMQVIKAVMRFEPISSWLL